MFGLKEAIDYVKLSKKSQVALFVSSLIIITAAQFDNFLLILGIKDLIENTLPIVSVLAIGLLGFIISPPIYDFVDNLYTTKRYKMRILGQIKHLTIDEKEVLKTYIDTKLRVHYFDLDNGVVMGLDSKGILYRTSQVSQGINYKFAFGIQDMVLDILKKHPEYLE